MKVLIAYDGSQCADGAIDDLCRAGLPLDTDALVISVADVWPQLPASLSKPLDTAALEQQSPIVRKCISWRRPASAEAQLLCEGAAGRLRSLFPSWNVQTQACVGSPAAQIIEAATREKADLVVVGSHGRSALGRMAFGSVSQEVVRSAPCSVRVARPDGAAASGPVKIIVGSDGSEGAAAALTAVAGRSWPAGSEVRVVVALDMRLSTVLPTTGEGQLWVQRMAQQAAENLEDAKLVAVPVLREGDPKRVLVEEAEQWGADCIFVGAKGMSRLERFVLGSVSSAISARASCSVEVSRGQPQ